jgi:hypothetical protein
MQITLELLFSPRLGSLLEEDTPEGVTVRILPVQMQRSADFTPVATVVMNFASNVAAGLFVAWLLEKIPERARKKITVATRETVWEKDELTRVIEGELETESGHWIQSDWTYDDLEGKSVQYAIDHGGFVERGKGTFMVREHGETHQLEIIVCAPQAAPYGLLREARYYLTGDGARQIHRHPDQSVADFRL